MVNSAPEKLRLNGSEVKQIEKKANEINKIRRELGLLPLTTTQILHQILDLSIPRVTVDDNGAVTLK